MSKRKRRVFTKEQKAETVRLVRTSGESLTQVARNLDLGENSLRNWVKQADIDEGKGSEGALTTAEKAEMRQLKHELKRVTMERDFLKKPRPLRQGDRGFEVILAEQTNFSVSMMCATLGVTRAAFYTWRQRPVSERKREDEQLLVEIKKSYMESRGTYGSPLGSRAIYRSKAKRLGIIG